MKKTGPFSRSQFLLAAGSLSLTACAGGSVARGLLPSSSDGDTTPLPIPNSDLVAGKMTAAGRKMTGYRLKRNPHTREVSVVANGHSLVTFGLYAGGLFYTLKGERHLMPLTSAANVVTDDGKGLRTASAGASSISALTRPDKSVQFTISGIHPNLEGPVVLNFSRSPFRPRSQDGNVPGRTYDLVQAKSSLSAAADVNRAMNANGSLSTIATVVAGGGCPPGVQCVPSSQFLYSTSPPTQTQTQTRGGAVPTPGPITLSPNWQDCMVAFLETWGLAELIELLAPAIIALIAITPELSIPAAIIAIFSAAAETLGLGAAFTAWVASGPAGTMMSCLKYGTS